MRAIIKMKLFVQLKTFELLHLLHLYNGIIKFLQIIHIILGILAFGVQLKCSLQ